MQVNAFFPVDWRKYGLSRALHLEVALNPFVRNTSKSATDRGRDSGVGDTVVKLKQELRLPVSGLSAAIIPQVESRPQSRRIGNGRVEGGVIVPLSLALGKTRAGIAADKLRPCWRERTAESQSQQAALGGRWSNHSHDVATITTERCRTVAKFLIEAQLNVPLDTMIMTAIRRASGSAHSRAEATIRHSRKTAETNVDSRV